MLLVGVMFPLVVLAIVDGARPFGLEKILIWLTQPSVANSFVGYGVCALSSIGILRRLRYLPGVAVARSILPIVALTFGLLIGVIAGLRLESYNKLIVSCFFAVVLLRFAITAMRSRSKGLLYYVVPGGRYDLIRQVKSAPVYSLNSPSLAGVPYCVIVADLHADLGGEWERFLADAAISGRPIYHYKHVWEAETRKVQIEHLSENHFGALLPNFS